MGVEAPATKDENAGGDRGWRVQVEGDLVRGAEQTQRSRTKAAVNGMGIVTWLQD
ncbi:hypothetical protein hamaS1_20150 [Moorella sp. Hama-1]|nr:hypothetical protein hamaS1_20150 [Moorella sp. Hama-1]